MAKKNSPNRYTTILAHWIQQQQPVAACCVIHLAKCALLLYYVYHAHQRAGESKGKWRIAFSYPAQLLKCTQTR
jgi:hypothetical protein